MVRVEEIVPRARDRLTFRRVGPEGEIVKIGFGVNLEGGSYLIRLEYLAAFVEGRLTEPYALFVKDSEDWKQRKKISGSGVNDVKDDDSFTGAGSGAQPRDKDE